MDLMKLIELMNYNFESKGTKLYNICEKFIKANQSILTLEQLKDISASLLPPNAFDDNRNRSISEYNNIQAIINLIISNKLNYEQKRGMVA